MKGLKQKKQGKERVRLFGFSFSRVFPPSVSLWVERPRCLLGERKEDGEWNADAKEKEEINETMVMWEKAFSSVGFFPFFLAVFCSVPLFPPLRARPLCGCGAVLRRSGT